MHLLTWHGTLLALDGSGQLIQVPLLNRTRAAGLLSLDLPPAGVRLPMVSGALPDLALLPGPHPRTLHVRQGSAFLCAPADGGVASFSRTAAQDWETFLALPETQTEALQRLLDDFWRLEDGRRLYRGAMRVGPAFTLELAARRIALATAELHVDPDGEVLTIIGTEGDGPDLSLRLQRDQSSQAESMILLRSVQHHPTIGDVATMSEFLAGSDRRLRLPEHREIVTPPLYVSDAHRDWSFERFWRPAPPRLGQITRACRIGRARSVGVVLARLGEGTLFDEAGVLGEDAHLNNMELPLPPGMIREDGATLLDAEVLRRAPVLPGTHIVFVNGNLQNYYHWVVDSLLALDIMHGLAPAGAQLLLPGTIADFRAHPINRFDHLDVLHAAGLDTLPLFEAPQGLAFARLEEAIWLEDHFIEEVPGVYLRAFRDRLLAGRPPSRARRRICIRRRSLRALANAPVVESFLARNGFEVHELEDMPAAEQIAMFEDAEFIVAPHGAGLANLLFCAAGTKVLELSPDYEFRPFFWLMSNKLGLSHAVLPSPTHDGTFNGRMRVDIDAFRNLFRMLLWRQ
jgi:capsular polysaccharide biosynthesis protein